MSIFANWGKNVNLVLSIEETMAYLRIEREFRHDSSECCKIAIIVQSRKIIKKLQGPH